MWKDFPCPFSLVVTGTALVLVDIFFVALSDVIMYFLVLLPSVRSFVYGGKVLQLMRLRPLECPLLKEKCKDYEKINL